MAELGISVAAKLAEYLVDPTLQQLQYLFCVSKITRNADTKKEELILKQRRVQERVEEAINRTERIDDEVNNWKNDVVSLIAEVENLVQELRANDGCIQKWCPTWRRYHICKKLAKTSQLMTVLNTKSDQLEPFSHQVIVPDIEYNSSKDFVLFKSTKKAHDELWAALQDDGSSIIGLWGMGGSGKTTLVKEVGQKAKELKLFDRVIITTVSQTPDIRKIQGEIADLLGLKLEEETEVGRARRIAMKLQGPEERILIIFDDVWATLNLEDVGNPFGDGGPRNCKVLLTTRRQEVCTLMDCQNTIPLGLLTEDEAWDLFQTHAKVDDGANEVAQEVAMECTGLPIAIVAMGKCLKGKGLDEVKVVLHKLRHSKQIDADEGVGDAFTCLKLSYDYLRTTEAKLLFLMCAMFPEDHEIIIEDLFRYGVGLGLCEDAGSFEIARSQVITAINVLIDSSLLMYSINFKNEKCVKMHDMVRDVALWIAPKEHGTIMVNCAEELNGFLEDKAVKDWYAISFWNKNLESLRFPSQLDSPKLELLLVNSIEPMDLSCASFEGVKRLQVVALISSIFILAFPSKVQLPSIQSIQWLHNLRTLRLQDWYLGDISFVVGLKRLEILDLKWSIFKKLPNGIEKLNRLKLLDLSKCMAEECFCKVVGKCSQLEELYISKVFHPSVYPVCGECFVGAPALSQLRRYTLIMGKCTRSMFRDEDLRELSIEKLNISIPSAFIKDLAQRAIVLEFFELQGGFKRFSPDVVQAIGGMNELTKLCLQCCHDIECFVDQPVPHEDIVVLRLDKLVLKSMHNLKQLCRGPSNLTLFQNLESLSIKSCPLLVNLFPTNCNLRSLKFLRINRCPMLTSLFSISVACTLLLLEKLTIKECHGLKHVIEKEDGVDTWEDPKFPKWETLDVCNCRQLESICPSFCVQGFIRLQYLSISFAPKLKFVFGEHVDEEITSVCDETETKKVLPLLEKLILKDLLNLLRIFSENYQLLWPSIKEIEWKYCPRLNGSWDSHIIGSEIRQPHPNMESHAYDHHQPRNRESKPAVAISNCGVVSTFTPQIPIFRYLEQLSVENCTKLRFVFSAIVCQNLPMLTSVIISCCEDMEEVFLANEETQKNLSIAQFCLPNLQSLQIKQCHKLKRVFSFMSSDAILRLPKLRTLNISNSSQLEEIFRCLHVEDHNDIDSEKEIMFPNLELILLEKLSRFAHICPGYKFQTSRYCKVLVYECPKLMPHVGASAQWIGEELVRKLVLKCSQLDNNEGLSPPLLFLNSAELDNLSDRLRDSCRVIGDMDSEMFSLHQIPKGLTPTRGLSFQFLHFLQMVRCEKLKFLFSRSTIVHNSLPKLKFLILSDCEELEEIIACNEEPQNISNGQVCFPELKVLRIQSCNKLKRLFSTPINNILPQLDVLLITDANQLEVIFANKREDDGNNQEKIVLPKLKELDLRNLPNFVNVCQGVQFEAVRLRSIEICRCPKFLNPISGSAQVVSLQQWKSTFHNDSRGVEDFQSEASVEKQSHVDEEKGTIKISNGLSLTLIDSDNLMTSLWEGPSLMSFQNLSSLRVIRYRKLKSIFPYTVINSLPCLAYLYIIECQELEEIVSENDHFPSPSSNTSLCFPKHLEIKGCSELEQVFSCELEIHEQESNKNLLPNLKYLTLKGLPKLTHICASIPFLLKFVPLRKLIVKDCPMLQNIDNVEESEGYDSDDYSEAGEDNDLDDSSAESEEYFFMSRGSTRQFLHVNIAEIL